MLWLVVILPAYFLLAIVALVDKYLISGPIPSPKVFSFYIGLLGILSLVLIPLGFSIPEPINLGLSILAGSIYIFALLALFSALREFEVSRIFPAIGAISPIFVLSLGYLLSGITPALNFLKILALLLLVSGGVLITFKKQKLITLKSLQISVLAAFLFALALTLTKFVYFTQPFWSGFIWMRIGGFLTAVFFLFFKEVREELFKKRVSFKPKTVKIFLANEAVGASAFILQNFAVALVPLSLLSFVNALEGTKYVFLLIFTFLVSFKFPKILKEEISRKVIFQKIIAILLIGTGLAILAFS